MKKLISCIAFCQHGGFVSAYVLLYKVLANKVFLLNNVSVADNNAVEPFAVRKGYSVKVGDKVAACAAGTEYNNFDGS